MMFLLENEFWVVFDPMGNQDLNELVLKRFLLMMLFLVLNVTLNRGFLRMADGECAVPRLPSKLTCGLDGIVDPAGGIRFDEFQHVGNKNRWGNACHDMNVIFNTTDFQKCALFLSNDTAYVLIESFSKFRTYGF